MSVAGRRFLLAGAVLSLAIHPALAQVGVALVESVPSITVEGEAKREVVPDLAIVTLGVSTDRATAIQAADDNARAASAIVASAQELGVDGGDIQTSQLRLSPVIDAATGVKANGFRASNEVTLRLYDLGRVGALIARLTAQGVNTIDGVSFGRADERPILDDLRGSAIQDAIRKAEIYVKAAHLKLGRVLRIVPTDVPSAPMARSFKLAMAASAAAPPVESGTRSFESRVQVTWELVP